MTIPLLDLLQLSDPALPIGGFAHSAGLETYVQRGFVTNIGEAAGFLTSMLTLSIHHTDAALVSLAYEAALEGNMEELFSLDWECSAVKMPSEIRLASQKLGNRLLKIFSALKPGEVVDAYHSAVKTQDTPGNYPVVFGLFAAVSGIDKQAALTGFYYNAAAGFITNAVKLVPLGQQQGQKLLFSLHPLINELAIKSMDPDRSMIGYNCPGFDTRCMQHERLYSRLYMS